jgi:multidrug resistance efflux pump
VLVTVDDREFVARADRARAALAEAELGLDETLRTLEEAAAALSSAEADHAYADAQRDPVPAALAGGPDQRARQREPGH